MFQAPRVLEARGAFCSLSAKKKNMNCLLHYRTQPQYN